MKKSLLLALFVLLTGLASFGQEKPGWIYNKPKPANDTYLYVVESSVGKTVIEARNNAIAEVFRSTAMRIGQPFDAADISSALQKGTDFNVISAQYNIPINKVCEYSEQSAGLYTVYLLCQVAKAGNIKVQWSDFNGCGNVADVFDGVAVIKSIFLPGLGQFHKGQNVKGACFLAGTAVCAGGGVFASTMRKTYINKMNNTTSPAAKQSYANKANMFTTVRNIAFGAAGAIYLWNVLDAAISRGGQKHVLAQTGPFNLSPVVTDEAVALSMSINF